MTDIIIRRARPEDAGSIAAMSDQLGYPATADEVTRRLNEIEDSDRHALYVAALPSGHVVGWVHLYVCNIMVDDRRAEIWGLVVDDAHRGKAIGRRLMSKAEEWARKKECGAVCLRSNIIRDRAHHFYEDLGYVKAKTQHVFRKDLSGEQSKASAGTETG